MCVRVSFYVGVSVCVITQKNNLYRIMKSEYILLYENSSDKFDIDHCRIKVNVTVCLQIFPHVPKYELSGPIIQFWYGLGSLNLRMYVHLIITYKIYEWDHA